MKKKLYTSLATGALALLTAPTAFAQTGPSVCTSLDDVYQPGGCLIEGTRTYEPPGSGMESELGRVVLHGMVGDDGVRSSDIALVGSGYELKAPGDPPLSPVAGITVIPNEARDALNAQGEDGVDIVYVDFGVDNNNFLQAKSYALQDAIRLLNDWRGVDENEYGGDDGNMIYIGLSLGGVIGRHALRSLEDQGYDHRVRTMFTWDSPHLGANIPIGIQQMPKQLIDGARFIADDISWILFLFKQPLRALANGVEEILDEMIDNPASQQLILKYVYESDLGMHPYAVELQRELAELEMPELSHNVAVSAGGIYGDGVDHGRKSKYFDLEAEQSQFFSMSFDVSRDDAEPYIEWVLDTHALAGEFPGELSLGTQQSIDTVPCSTIPFAGDFSNFVFDNIGNYGFDLTSGRNYRDNENVYDQDSCFVPTLSSMGIDSLDITTQNFEILANIEGSTMLSELEALSPFDELYAGHSGNYNHHTEAYWVFQDSFEQHLDSTYGTGAPATPCSEICENATVFEQPNQQLTNLGTNALCMEFPESVSGMVFGGLESSRDLSVNGVSFGTGSWTDNLPAAFNGGYCMSAQPGSDAWAWLSTWQ